TNTVNALDQILSVSQNPPVLPKEKFISMMLKETSEIFPEKYNFVGDEALNLLFNKGVIEAQNYEMKSTQGWLLICVLKIAFGDGCTIDPLYPWIERTLKDEKITDSEKRLNRLKNKSITWLRQVIANFKNKERQ
ncbi:MAG: hypothetical protein U9R19_05465, partial [Bacteroidota bacterium]|nr:hypothetical protein [Bacteroidota bacterium]